MINIKLYSITNFIIELNVHIYVTNVIKCYQTHINQHYFSFRV